jgi:ABC-type transport system involved in cytochrome c biogenesis permease subunit
MALFPSSLASATALGYVALLCYAISAGFYVAHLRKPHPAFGWAATGLAAVGAILNLDALYARSVALHSVPYRDLVGSMALLGFFLAVISLLLEIRHRDRSLGPYLMPVVFFFLLVALRVPPSKVPPAPELKGPIFAFHVTLNMLAYAALAVACALSALYLVAGRALKSGKDLTTDGAASRLPSLRYLERANRTSLGLGVLASTCGFLLGGYWASRVWRPEHPFWAADPKVISVLLILVFYWAVLIRAHRGAAPVTTARLSVMGFVLVIVSYTAVNLFASRLHTFYR